MSQFHPEDASGTQIVTSNQDVVLASDRDQTGAGDIVFKTGGVERARINYAGVGTGWSNVLGGSQTFLADLASANLGTAGNVRADVTKLVSKTGSALTVLTGYAGNDIVEPSVLFDARAPFAADANGKNGYEYVLCAAPYSGSNAIYENPCLWVSHDGTTWYPIKFTAGVGVVDTAYAGGYTVTPVVANAVQGDGNNSDPFLCRGPDGTYYILWNQALVATGSGGTGTGSNDWGIKGVSASSLLGPWTTPTSLVQTVSGTIKPSSPSALWDGTQWHIYAIDITNTSSTAILRYTAPTLLGTWTKQTNPSISVPSAYSSQVWWHMNAYRWGSSHLLVVQDSQAGTSGAGNLWAIISNDDGSTFTVPTAPMLPFSVWYRAAAVVADIGLGKGLDLFYGTLGANWGLNRTTASWKSSAVEPQFPPTGNAWRVGPSFGGAGTVNPVQNTVYAAAILIYKNVPISAIGTAIAGAGGASSVVRLGVYADNGNGYPGSLLFDAGTIDGTSATFQEIAVTKALLPGLYWLAAVWQVGTAGTIAGVNGLSPLVAENPSTAASGNRAAYTLTGVTGALPASFGAPSAHDFGVRVTLKIT